MIKYIFISCLILSTFSQDEMVIEGIPDINDDNFVSDVTQDGSFWIVAFTASWCGHCKQLKPQLQKLNPMLERIGAKLGVVDEHASRKLINDHVVNHQTHMVSYPKLKVFLGEQVMGQVPGNMRTAEQIFYWFIRQFNFDVGQQL